MKNKPTFEFETCGRCAGSGHYSYCQMYGTTCFGCGGRGYKLTKRGQAAQNLFTRLASKRTDELTLGESVWYDSPFGGTGWSVVESIHVELAPGYANDRYTHIGTKRCGFAQPAETTMRVRQSSEQRAAILDVCIAYERSLNKKGEVSKSLAKVMREVAF